jgi:predicted CoA-binding protein
MANIKQYLLKGKLNRAKAGGLTSLNLPKISEDLVKFLKESGYRVIPIKKNHQDETHSTPYNDDISGYLVSW